MEYKRIEDLNIKECAEYLTITCEDLKSIVSTARSQDSLEKLLEKASHANDSILQSQIIRRLSDLLLSDKNSILACVNRGDLRDYVLNNDNGLWTEEAIFFIKMSTKELYLFISSSQKSAHPLLPVVKAIFHSDIALLRQQEEKDYSSCVSRDDYKSFIEKYSGKELSQYYNALHVDDAKNAWEEVKKQEKRIYFSIFFLVSVVLLSLFFYLAYSPVESLTVNEAENHPADCYRPIEEEAIPNDYMYFNGCGGWKKVIIQTDAFPNNVSFNVEGSDFQIKWEKVGRELYIQAKPNDEGPKHARLQIKAYSSLFGVSFQVSKEITLVLYQASGIANELNVYPESITLGNDGQGQNLCVETDGVALDVSSEDDWLHIREESVNKDRHYFKIYADENYDEAKQGTILVRSGEKIKTVNATQKSGFATFISVKNPYNKSIYSSTKKYSNQFGTIYCTNYMSDDIYLNFVSDGIEKVKIYTENDCDWIKIEDGEPTHILISINKGSRRNSNIWAEIGDVKGIIEVVQPSGLASRLDCKQSIGDRVEDASSILVPDEGYWEDDFETFDLGGKIRSKSSLKNLDLPKIKKGYEIIIDTDGFWELYSVPNWIYAEQKAKTIMFWVNRNSEVDRHGSIKIRTSSNIEKIISVTQGVGYTRLKY